jgi:predicted transcriptional regulator
MRIISNVITKARKYGLRRNGRNFFRHGKSIIRLQYKIDNKDIKELFIDITIKTVDELKNIVIFVLKLIMKRLTAKEEEIMNFFWEKGELFVKQVLSFYPEPKPHYNTISTIVRGLEEKGFLGYKDYGTTYLYYPVISRKDYNSKNLKYMVRRYFDNSFRQVVSSFVEEEDLTVEDLKEIIREIEKKKKGK